MRSRRFPHFIAPFYKKRRKFGKKSSKRIDGCVRGFTSTSSLRGFNPFTPGTFCKKRVFLDILVTFRLDPGQITFNSVENGHQHRALGHCDSGMRRNQYGRHRRQCVKQGHLVIGERITTTVTTAQFELRRFVLTAKYCFKIRVLGINVLCIMNNIVLVLTYVYLLYKSQWYTEW